MIGEKNSELGEEGNRSNRGGGGEGWKEIVHLCILPMTLDYTICKHLS